MSTSRERSPRPISPDELAIRHSNLGEFLGEIKATLADFPDDHLFGFTNQLDRIRRMAGMSVRHQNALYTCVRIGNVLDLVEVPGNRDALYYIGKKRSVSLRGARVELQTSNNR